MEKFKVMIEFFRAATGSLSRAAFELVEARINQAIRRDLMSSLVVQEVAFFDSKQTGALCF